MVLDRFKPNNGQNSSNQVSITDTSNSSDPSFGYFGELNDKLNDMREERIESGNANPFDKIQEKIKEGKIDNPAPEETPTRKEKAQEAIDNAKETIQDLPALGGLASGTEMLEDSGTLALDQFNNLDEDTQDKVESGAGKWIDFTSGTGFPVGGLGAGTGTLTDGALNAISDGEFDPDRPMEESVEKTGKAVDQAQKTVKKTVENTKKTINNVTEGGNLGKKLTLFMFAILGLAVVYIVGQLFTINLGAE